MLFFFLDIFCLIFLDIVNVLKIFDGVYNGSVIMYVCFLDYVVSNVVNIIVCNEISWMLINFFCFLGISYKFIFVIL